MAGSDVPGKEPALGYGLERDHARRSDDARNAPITRVRSERELIAALSAREPGDLKVQRDRRAAAVEALLAQLSDEERARLAARLDAKAGHDELAQAFAVRGESLGPVHAQRLLTMLRTGAVPSPSDPNDMTGAPSASASPSRGASSIDIARHGVAEPAKALPHGDQIQAAFGAHDIGGIRAHVGGPAAEASTALGARAFAVGRDVAFTDTPDLHTAAHEAAHHVQQQGGVSLPGGLDTPGDAHEQHADRVADAVVRGESAAPLLDPLAGAAPRAEGASSSDVVQRKPAGASPASTAPVRQLPAGQHYKIAGEYACLLDVAWYSEGAVEQNGRLVSVAKTTEMLGYLRRAGMFPWATPETLAEAAKQLGIPAGLKAPEVTMRIGANVLAVIGLPPNSSAMVSRDGEGLRVAVRLETPAGDTGPIMVKGSTVDAVYHAIEAFTGMPIPKGVRTDEFMMLVGSGAVHRIVSNATLEDLFGAEAWTAWKKENGAGKAGATAAANGPGTVSVAAELTDAERVRLTTWLTQNLGSPTPGGGASSALSRELLAMIDDVESGSLKRYRGGILDYLKKHKVADGVQITPSVLRQAIDTAMEKTVGPDKGGSDTPSTDPILDEPLPATMTYSQGLALDGDTVKFQVAFDWAALHRKASGRFGDTQQGADFADRPWNAEVRWVFDRIGGSKERAGMASLLRDVVESRHDSSDIHLAHKLALDPGEREGTWIVHAFVRTSHFPITRVSTQIQVKSEAARMDDLRKDALGGLAQSGALEREDDRFTGPLAFKPRSDSQRADGRHAEIARLTEVRDYLRQHAGQNADAISAVEQQIERRREQDAKIASDKINGWRTFDVRATFLSKVDEVPSGPLDIYGAFKMEELGPGVPVPTVMLRDQSRRFEQTEYTFKGHGTTFEEALADATKQLAKDYPRGRLALFAEEQDPTGQRSTGKTIGFERETYSTWKAVKDKVFHPLAQIAVAAASAAVMIFVPPAAAVIPLLVETVYSTVQTADDLIQRSQNGTLSSSMMAMDIATIGLGVMPFLSLAKPIRTSRGAMFGIEIANVSGQMLLMAASVKHTLAAMQAQDVAVIAQMYGELLEAQKTFQASDPRLAVQRAQIDARAEAVRGRLRDAVSSVAGQQMLFMVPDRVFTAVQRGRQARDKSESGWVPSDRGTPVAETDWADLHRELSGDDKAPATKPTVPRTVKPTTPGEGAHDAPETTTSNADETVATPKPVADAMNPALGVRIAEMVPGAVYRGDGVFTVPVEDGEVTVRVRRTSGRVRVAREGAEVVLEVPRDIDETTLRHAVADGLDEVRRAPPVSRAPNADGTTASAPSVVADGKNAGARIAEGVAAGVGGNEREAVVRDTSRVPTDSAKGQQADQPRRPPAQEEREKRASAVPEKRPTVGNDPESNRIGESDSKTRAPDGKQLEKPDKEGVEEANTRRSEPLKPMSGSDEKWAKPSDRKGVPEDVPLTAQEVRDVITAKYKDTIDKYANDREHTANPKYLEVMEKIRKLGPNGAKTPEGAELIRQYMKELDAVSKEIVKGTGQDPDAELRLLYNVVEQDLMKKQWLPHVGQLPLEQQARLAQMWREEWKIMVRDLMTDMNQKEALYLRDLALSGDRRGRRFAEFYEKNLKQHGGNSDEAHQATIASAFTSNAEVNMQKTGYADGIDAVKAKDMREKAAARDTKIELENVRAENKETVDKERASKQPKVSDKTPTVGKNDEGATGAATQEGNAARRAEIHLADDKPAKLQLTPEAQTLRDELDVLDQLRRKHEEDKKANASAEELKVIADDISGHQKALDAKLKDPRNKEHLFDSSVMFGLIREANAPGASKGLKAFLSSNIDAVRAAQAQSRQGVDPVLRAKREVFEREIALAVLNDGPVKEAVDKNLQMMCDKAKAYIEKSRPPGAERDEALAMLGAEASGGYAGGVMTEAAPDKKKPRNEAANAANAATMMAVLESGNVRERMIAIGKFAELVASDAQNDPAKVAAGSKPRTDLDAGGVDFTEADAKAFQARLDQYNKDRGYDGKDPTKKAPDTKDFLKPVSNELGPDGRQTPYQKAKKQDADAKLPGVFTRDAEDFMGRNLTQKESSDSATGTTKGGEASPIARTTMTIEEAQAMGLNLSPREIKAAKEGKLPWIVGTTANIIDPQSAFIKSGTQASMPQKAGISGTTFRFMEASALLGGDALQSRLAMIGALQAIDAHTFYEIANAAAGFGLAYNQNKPYANLLPEPILRALAEKSGSTLDELNGTARSTEVTPDPQAPR